MNLARQDHELKSTTIDHSNVLIMRRQQADGIVGRTSTCSRWREGILCDACGTQLFTESVLIIITTHVLCHYCLGRFTIISVIMWEILPAPKAVRRLLLQQERARRDNNCLLHCGSNSSQLVDLQLPWPRVKTPRTVCTDKKRLAEASTCMLRVFVIRPRSYCHQSLPNSEHIIRQCFMRQARTTR